MQIKLIRPVLFGIVLFFILMVGGIGSADEVNVDFVSHIGGTISDVAVAGDYAYIGQGQDFVVLDISDKSNPVEVGKLTTPSIISYVTVSGNYAYAINTNGLNIVNITNPSSPIITGSYSPSYYSVASSVAVSGDYVYLGVFNGFDILDITNPSSPRNVGEYRYLTSPGTYGDVNVEGNYVYLSLSYYNGIADLQIVDISDSSSPKLVGSYTDHSDRDMHDVAVLGNYAYLLTGNKGLVILDVTNSSSPTFVSSYDIGNYYSGCEVDISFSEDCAYIADGMNGLTIVDITNASSPKTIVNFDTGYFADDVFLSGDYAYVTDNSGGLVIVDIVDSSSPSFAGSYNIIGEARDVIVSDNYAYLIGAYNGLVSFEVNDPFSPGFSGRIDLNPVLSRNIAKSGHYAYIAHDYSGLVIADISIPSSPIIVGNYSCNPSDVAISGNYAYVLDGSGKLLILNITNPASPTFVSIFNVGWYGAGPDIAVSDNYAYIADNTGLVIVDISTPSSPVLAASYNPSPYRLTFDLAIVDKYVYLATIDGIDIVDVIDPFSPKSVCKYDIYATSIDVVDKYAYVSSMNPNIVILDVSNPSSPNLVGNYNTAGGPCDVAVEGNYVYVADGGNGLVILRPNLLQYELNKVSRDTIYKYQISDTEIDNYVNQGYSSSEINQKLREQIVSDKQGRVLSALIEASENEQQKGEIQSIIDNNQHDFEILAVKLNEYVEEKVAEPSSFWNSAKEKSYFTILPEDKGFLKDTAISLIQDFAGLSDKFSMKILSGAGTIVSYVDTRESQEELEQDLIESENAVSTDVSNSVMIVSKISSVFSPLADWFDRTGYTSNVIDTSAGNLVKVTAKLGEKKVTVPQKVEEEWKYVWSTVGDNKAVVLSATDDLVYVNDMHCQARVYDNPSDEKEVHYYIHINGKLREDFIGKKFGWRETGHWREIRKLSATKWEIVPVTESSSGFVSQASPYSTDELTDKVESNSLNDVYPMQISNVFSNDTNGDGFADILGFDIVGDGKSNLLYTDVNGDQIFDMWEYTDATNHIIGYDITGDGKTDVYDMDSDGNEDAWDLDGDGKIDQIDLNNDGKVEAYDTNYDGSLDTFVECGHEIVAWINSIPYGATYSKGENILFNGSVFNGTKRAVPPFDYTWNSDKDGLIGKGKTINLSNLSLGNHTISLTVNDSNGSSDVRSIPIVILSSIQNTPPVFEKIGNKTVTVNSYLSFTILATDSEGDKINYSATGMPTGAVLNETTGVFSWTPSTIGIYDVTFTAVANGLNDSETITITVSDWNPWNDPDSAGGEPITLSELQEAIYDWRFGIPASTGEMVNLTRLQELIYSWRFG